MVILLSKLDAFSPLLTPQEQKFCFCHPVCLQTFLLPPFKAHGRCPILDLSWQRGMGLLVPDWQALCRCSLTPGARHGPGGRWASWGLAQPSEPGLKLPPGQGSDQLQLNKWSSGQDPGDQWLVPKLPWKNARNVF